MSADLSVVVITRDAAETLDEVLAAASRISDDLVVVDSGSGDDTLQIARAHGARVFERAWTGFSDQKAFGNEQARHDRILSLDADEVLDDDLIAAIRSTDWTSPDRAGRLRFKNMYLGRWMRHGGWGRDRHIRLFDRRTVRWDDRPVHEGLVLPADAEVVDLDGFVVHHTVRSISQHLRKIDRYTDLARDAEGPAPAWRMVVHPLWKFTRFYVLRLGCLDGVHGFILAAMQMVETFLKYAKRYRADRTGRQTSIREHHRTG